MKQSITVIPGDGIGPEITRATLQVLEALGVPFDWEICQAGEKVFAQGISSGVPEETIDSICRTRVVLKGPLATAVGEGGKSANVTIRKLFELYANIRPAFEIPGVATPFSGRGINLVIVRENVEDLYAGIEHMQSPQVAQAIKLITRGGSEKVIRTAFEFAAAQGRKKLHCATKANIMKLSEGEFKRTFERVSAEYPAISAEHIIIDNLAHLLVRRPEQFDVAVMTNMNGDIISDLTSGLVGGLGVTSSMNYGKEAVMFEAVHGTAPDIAGKGLANPTALLFSAELMLRHLGYSAEAMTLWNALMATYEDGRVRTGDLQTPLSKPAGTLEFAEAVIGNFGNEPSAPFRARPSQAFRAPALKVQDVKLSYSTRRDIGVDIFIESTSHPEELGKDLEGLSTSSSLELKMISNRGMQAYPNSGGNVREFVDVHRARFMMPAGREMPAAAMIELMHAVAKKHRIAQTETLLEIDGKPAFSLAQGER